MVDDELSDDDIGSIRKLAFALDDFEPYPIAVIPKRTLDRLARKGLVERGRSCRPSVGPVGYRLSVDGWRIAKERWIAW